MLKCYKKPFPNNDSYLKAEGNYIHLFVSLPLLVSFPFLNGCTTPEENAVTLLKQNGPAPDSSQVFISNTYKPKIYTVEISGMKFHPDEITVHKGDTVIWKNNDIVTHCVTELPSNTWTSSKIPAGESWKMAVTTSADYFCAIHLVMKGKIIVK